MTAKVVARLIFSLIGMSVLLAVYAQPRTNPFRDKQGRFTVVVPQGWTAKALDKNAVQIAAPPAYVTIFALQTTANARQICSQMEAQIYSQWEGLEVVLEGPISLSGRPAYAAVFTGKNPQGVLSSLRIVGLSWGDRGYALMFSVPGDRFDAVKSALDKIEHSFSVAQGSDAMKGTGAGEGAAKPEQHLAQPAVQIPRSGVPVFPVRAQFCSAMAPAGWNVTSALPDGKGLFLEGRGFYASYSIMPVQGTLTHFEPGRYANPHAFVQQMDAELSQSSGQGPILRTSKIQQYGDMFVKEIDNAYSHMVSMYSFYPMSLGGYVLVLRHASGPRGNWQTYGTIAIMVAGSIRCQAQYSPSPNTGSGGRSASGTSGRSTYNAQLGTEYAHDPETGESFFMTHATDWMENGPDGPGYYRQIGNSYRKLVPGLSE
jgi:hypothetical protein